MHAGPVSRRTLLLALPALPAALAAARVHAHHGWTRFDTNRPLYLAGRATAVRWENPHVELILEVPSDLALPADLASRTVPAQQAAVDGPGILAKTTVPARHGAWTCELAPLTRMQAWSVPRLETGAWLELVGYTFGDRDEPMLRAEWVWVRGRAYPLRSLPV